MIVALINDCVLFPHRFAWRSKPVGRRSWQTGIDLGLKGAEARQAMRSVSRREVSVEIFARDSERVRLEARIDAAKKSGFGCAPLTGRGSYLTANAASGANSIHITTDAWRWQAGDYVSLIADDQTFDVAAVTGPPAAGVLPLATPLNFPWASGYVVRPVIFGAFSAEKQTVITGRAAGWRITVAEMTSGRSAQIGIVPARGPGIGQQQIGVSNLIGG